MARKSSTKSKKTVATKVVITAEDAMEAIREFVTEHGKGWREALREKWAGDDDGTALVGAREVIPDAILDSLSFKPPRPKREPRPLTPEQATARRLRQVGTAFRARARSLQERAKEMHALARTVRQGEKDAPAVMKRMHDGGELAELETEAGIE